MDPKLPLVEFAKNIYCFDSSSEDDEVLEKVDNYAEITVPFLSDQQFKQNFRLNVHTFEDLLSKCNQILQDENDFHSGFPKTTVEKELMITIWYLANMESLRSIAERFGVSKSTCWDILYRTCNLILKVNKVCKVISWPNRERQAEIRNSFSTHGFPGEEINFNLSLSMLFEGNGVVKWQQYDDFDNPQLKKGASEQADDVSPDSLPEYQIPPPRKIDQYIKAEIPCLSRRATVSLLCCTGFIIMFGMRETMGMVNSEIEGSGKNITISRSTVSAVESAIFWGYFVTQIPGGLIAAAYPANKLFGAAIGSSCLLNLLIPSLYDNPTLLIIIKVMQGLVEGVTYPACHGIMRYWAPPLERSRLATIAFSGCYAGVMFSMMICGILINNISLMAPFYFYSFAGMIWYASWLWLVFEKPSLHTCIDPKELIMIEKSLGGSQQHYTNPTLRSTPWKSFFTSLPCYAIFVANFCRSWNFYLLVLFQALYFKEAFGTTTVQNASLGALPHLLMTLVVPAGGIMADRLRKKGTLNTTQVRKLFNCGGFGLEATFFIAMAYSQTTLQGMTALTIGVAFSGFAISGFNVNHLDIAPRYASILMGLSNGIGTIAGAIVPVAKNVIVQHSTREEWRILIILSAFIHYGGIIFYGIFASGELQPWADPKAEEERQWNQMNEAVAVTKYASQSNGLLQRQPSGGVTNYGAATETAFPSSRSSGPKQQMSHEVPARPPAPRALSQEGMPPQQAMVSSGNPFRAVSANPFREEAIQPAPHDSYMHGSIEDRSFVGVMGGALGAALDAVDSD